MATKIQDKKLSAEAMAQPVTVRPIETKADFRQFFEFPWVLYKDDANWVPPLLSMRRDMLDKHKNPSWEYMEGQYFGAWRGDTLVGTITAFVNHRHNEIWKEHIGWFGTFEFYDDPQIAQALLETATQWVKERGYDAIRGPQSFTTHEETGLLVDGFKPAVIMMPYNPPYYQNHIEAAGFMKVMDTYSMYCHRDMEKTNGMGARLQKLAQWAMKRHNITIRKLDAKKKVDEFRLFRDIYNQAWDANWGFVPMNDKELDALIESLGMFVEPDMAYFAMVNGEPAGFSLAVPDFNEMLHKAYPRPGVPEIWTLLQVGWQWKIAKTTKGVRLPFMGVKAEFRDMGIHTVLLSANFDNFPAQYDFIDCGWILETNPLTQMSLKLGANPYKTHRYYEKKLK
jgi:GNAT superfamily N-acetyltransferase